MLNPVLLLDWNPGWTIGGRTESLFLILDAVKSDFCWCFYSGGLPRSGWSDIFFITLTVDWWSPHSVVVSSTRSSFIEACQQWRPLQWDRWKTVTAPIPHTDEELNSGWLSMAFWRCISLKAAFLFPQRGAYSWFLPEWSQHSEQQGRSKRDKDGWQRRRRSFVRCTSSKEEMRANERAESLQEGRGKEKSVNTVQ